MGPLLRHVGAGRATVWVETSEACEVEVLGCTQCTFEVEGHHFALVEVTGLPQEGNTPYEVHLDGQRHWPPGDAGWEWPASCIRTIADDHDLRVSFGSCRCSYPNRPPYTLTKDQDPDGREHDALRALALRMRHQEPSQWPDLLLMLGDQVYADEIPPATREWIEQRRDLDVPPGDTIANFQEYCRLYFDAWTDTAVRWLLSTVPTAMIFDDHDVIDDWNTSADWVAMIRAKGWWDERIVGGFMSYWCYQHLGNLAPEDRERDEIYTKVLAAEGDAGPIVREFAFRADREVDGARWSYRRDIGRTRLIMMDSRGGRVLTPGQRSMVDEDEWNCIVEWTKGDFDHLLLGTSLPVFMARGTHFLEAWNEAVADGAWGKAASRVAEKIRQGLDLEHWAAFGDSQRRLEQLLEDVASGRHGQGTAPASTVLMSGDVHHAYLARVHFATDAGHAPVYQAVCSPFRNPLDSREQKAMKTAMSGVGERVGRALARAASVAPGSVTWDIEEGPWFDNQVAMLDISRGSSVFRIEKALGAGDEDPHLEEVCVRRLA
ncbi:MAG: alkaline phosphatase D family protein [Solirubrobacteraceae bacterium]